MDYMTNASDNANLLLHGVYLGLLNLTLTRIYLLCNSLRSSPVMMKRALLMDQRCVTMLHSLPQLREFSQWGVPHHITIKV
jgi:hypothetical protein